VKATVAVASHERPLRLRWLLNALEEQTVPREDFEVVVCHDSGEETEALLRDHPLGVRHLRLAPGTGSAARQRNAAWRAGRAPVVLFTDDDCRPPADWVERMLAAVERRPGAVVQGAVRPDPVEAHLLAAAPHARSLLVDPPVPWGQCANIAYPREVLERLGGFDESFARAGEDADLALRAIEAGVEYAGAREALTFHAVAPYGLLGALRTLPRWGELARVAARHPAVRRRLALGVFWKPSHAWLLAALVARPALLGWALAARPRYGRSPRGVARALAELPGRAVVDAVEIAVLARGSVRERTLLL
jgi:cellulose synthase/poly-beta-1,6-N-acetylglucosamine synthase-like glycosyltransferase